MRERSQDPSSAVSQTVKQRALAFSRDPSVRFFAIGALLFVVHRLVTGDPRVIEVTPGVRADLERKFRDHQQRAPSPGELDEAVRAWRRDEALYREALHDGLERDDPTIRTVLADKVRARAALALPQREPTPAELDAWLDAHRARYETPRRFDYQVVPFPKTEDAATERRAEFERALEGGKDPASLGRPILGGALALEELRKRLGTELADKIVGLPVGGWERHEDAANVLLVRLRKLEGGGLPAAPELRARLSADILAAEQEQAVERAVEEIVRRYRFEERK